MLRKVFIGVIVLVATVVFQFTAKAEKPLAKLIPAQTISSPLAMEAWVLDEPGSDWRLVGSTPGKVAVPACADRRFAVWQPRPEEMGDIAAEFNRLGITRVNYLYGSSREVVRLLMQDCPKMIALQVHGSEFRDADLPLLAKEWRSLETLELPKSETLKSTAAFSGLKNLRTLDLSWCYVLEDLSGIAGMEDLESLDLGECIAVTDLAPLESLKKLKHLTLPDCTTNEQFNRLAEKGVLKNLETLDLHSCTKLTDLKPLVPLKSLANLTLPPTVTEGQLARLLKEGVLARLDTLGLRRCDNISTLAPLGGLKKLRRLRISGCDKIESLEPLEKLPELEELEVLFCKKVKVHPLTSPLVDLKKFNIQSCPNYWFLCEKSRKRIDLSEIQKTDIIGHLGVPLGKIVSVEGVVADSTFRRRKIDAGQLLLRVQIVNGQPLKRGAIFHFANWQNRKIAKPKVGDRFHYTGYETGGFEGSPAGEFKYIPLRATTGYGFTTRFVPLKDNLDK